MNYRLLLVDDQKGIRRLLAELFKKDDFVIEFANDGLEAVEKHREFNPHLTIMDMKMPKLNGLDAAKIILKENQVAAIIIMTAHGENKVIEEILAAGVKRCITKPFDIMVLRDMVFDLLKQLYGYEV